MYPCGSHKNFEEILREQLPVSPDEPREVRVERVGDRVVGVAPYAAPCAPSLPGVLLSAFHSFPGHRGWMAAPGP